MKLIIAKGNSFDDSNPKLKEVECSLFEELNFSQTANLDYAKNCFIFLDESQYLNIRESAEAHGEDLSALLVRISNQLLKDRFPTIDWNTISVKPLSYSNQQSQFSIWNFGRWNRFDDISEKCKAIIPPLPEGSILSISHITWGQQLGIGIFTGDNDKLLEFLIPNLKDRLQNIPGIYEDSENYLHSL